MLPLVLQNVAFGVTKCCLWCYKMLPLGSETPSRSKAQMVPKKVLKRF